MEFPADLRYSTDHEWVRAEGNVVRLGITDFAQDNLGDIVYVQLPEVGASVETGGSFSEVESTKSVSDIYSPVDGTITEVNAALEGEPTLLNSDPYGAGWIVAIELSDPSQLDEMLDADGYRALVND